MDWIPNLHPPATALPIAFCLLLLAIEVVRFRVVSPQLNYTRDIVLVAFAVGVSLAFFSGYHGSEFVDMSRSEIVDPIATHHTWGKLLLFVTVPMVCCGFLSTRATAGVLFWKIGYVVAFVCVVYLTIYTGWLGGELVFSLGAGVAPRIP